MPVKLKILTIWSGHLSFSNGRDNADRDAYQDTYQQARDRQLDGSGEIIMESIRYRPIPFGCRKAKVESTQVANIIEILNNNRIIKMVLGNDERP